MKVVASILNNDETRELSTIQLYVSDIDEAKERLNKSYWHMIQDKPCILTYEVTEKFILESK